MNAKKQFAVMGAMAFLFGFLGICLASGALERVGLEMQEIVCIHH